MPRLPPSFEAEPGEAPHEMGGPDGAAPLVASAAGPEDMKRLGAALAKVLCPGDTVLLGGELGAGKTTFTQGLAAGLGVTEAVTSPTFVLLHAYRARAGWDLLHVDVWRLAKLQEVVDLAVPEMQEEGAAVVVEWGEVAAPALAPDCLYVTIEFEQGAGASGGAPASSAAGARRVTFSARGESWSRRMSALAAALDC